MRKIIYYVATSLDGYIAGPDGDISGFVSGGNGVGQYLADLQAFDTVIMGKNTYEFGYQYGLKPGQPAYPHMEHYIFSNSLNISELHEKVHLCRPDLHFIRKLKEKPGTPIYLCGGGEFAGWLLQNRLIDELKVKLNPFLSGQGICLFGNNKTFYRLRHLETQSFEQGLQIIHYQMIYD